MRIRPLVPSSSEQSNACTHSFTHLQNFIQIRRNSLQPFVVVLFFLICSSSSSCSSCFIPVDERLQPRFIPAFVDVDFWFQRLRLFFVAPRPETRPCQRRQSGSLLLHLRLFLFLFLLFFLFLLPNRFSSYDFSSNESAPFSI